MKKTITAITILTLAIGTLSAAFIPVPSGAPDPLFSSPALARNAEEDVNAHWDVWTGSDFSALSFLADPVKGLDKASSYIGEELAKKDAAFWESNKDILNLFSSIDPENFPSVTNLTEHDLAQIRMYFRNVFRSDTFGAVNRAHAVSSLAESHPELFPMDSSYLLGGDLSLGTEVWGLHAHDGFAWKWNVKMDYRTPESLLRGNGALTLEAGVNAAYAFELFSPSFTLGFQARPSIIIDNIQTGPGFMNARMGADAIALFTEPMRLGTGIELDIGLMWEPSDVLSFLLDFRNAPSFRSYFEWPLTNLAEGNLKPDRDRNIYYEAPDIALSSIYESGALSFKLEIAHIMDQLLWMDRIEGYDFNYYQVVDMSLSYDIDEDLTLRTGLGKEKLMLGVEWKDFSAELTTKLDRGYLGLTVGYEW